MIDAIATSYPQVMFDAIPTGNLLAGIYSAQSGMDKFERRRLALVALIKGLGRGGIKKVAAKIGKDDSYVSRMQYEITKKGAKRIGEDSVEALNEAFPGWLEKDGDASVIQLPEKKPGDQFSPLGMMLAQMFDRIPEDDLIGRSQAFSAASIEIRAVLDAPNPQRPSDFVKK